MGRRRAEETELRAKPGIASRKASGFAVCGFMLYRNDSAATAGHIHTKCLVMLDQAVKNLLRRQVLVNVDCDGHCADGKRRAGVGLFVRYAGRRLHRVRAVRRRDTQAVLIAADVEITLHGSSMSWSEVEQKAGRKNRQAAWEGHTACLCAGYLATLQLSGRHKKKPGHSNPA